MLTGFLVFVGAFLGSIYGFNADEIPSTLTLVAGWALTGASLGLIAGGVIDSIAYPEGE